MKLIALVTVAVLPLLILNAVQLVSIARFQNSYDRIISNMTIANNYNLNFKEELDECIYKLVFNGTNFGKPEENAVNKDSVSNRKNPYMLIYELRNAFTTLEDITRDPDSKAWLSSLLRNIDTLEDRVDDIRANIRQGGLYNESIEMLDKNIYILTELIDDDIQYYIYYQTRSMEQLRDRLSYSIAAFRRWDELFLLALIIVIAAISFAFQRSIIRPLGELTRVTVRIADGDFAARTGIYSKDELGSLSGAVNDMAAKLEIMVDQIKDNERKMRNAELRLLQEQINPHFLYNTLDTIVWLIEGGKNEQAEDMVISLSDFFKLALSHGREFITIREEELHIRSYLQIQQVRYQDILTYEIAIDPGIYQYKILKLTLQPLVENALYHGIKPLRARGEVVISGRMHEDHTIHLIVEDNGVGMQPEELRQLRRDLSFPSSDEKTAGFGMANVNERIRLNFGKEYGLSIDSAPGRGTRIEIVIPAIWIDQSSTQQSLQERDV